MIINRITKCVLMTLFLFIVGGQCQAKDYSPEELLLLMKTSCQRYKTMNAEVEATYYKGHDESGKRITQRTQEIIYRWTPDRYYSEVNERYIDRPIDMRENILYKKATTGKWTKTLMIRPEGNPRGTIELGRESLDKFTNPNCAMWDINQMGIPMDKTGIDLNRASVETDKTTGYLVMKFRLGEHEKAAQVVLYIDPTRDYIPIINEFKRCDGHLITRQTCKLHRNPDGLWIPEEYFWEDPEADYLAVHKVKKIEINTTIPEELLNFEFPNGTYVLDKIQNLKYIKGPSSPREPKSLTGKSLPDLKDLGINLSPVDVNDKKILICFFDYQQRPSRNCAQELSQKAQELKEKSVITIAVQASKIEQAKIDEWVKESNINTTIGMIQSKQEQTLSKWGVISLPWLILTDKDHIVTAEGFGLDELDKKIKDGEEPGG